MDSIHALCIWFMYKYRPFTWCLYLNKLLATYTSHTFVWAARTGHIYIYMYTHVGPYMCGFILKSKISHDNKKFPPGFAWRITFHPAILIVRHSGWVFCELVWFGTFSALVLHPCRVRQISQPRCVPYIPLICYIRNKCLPNSKNMWLSNTGTGVSNIGNMWLSHICNTGMSNIGKMWFSNIGIHD